MRLLATSFCALALGAACAACGDDRNTVDPGDDDPVDPPADPARQFTMRIENVAPWNLIKLSSQRSKTTRVEGALDPGDAYEILFTAAPGHRVSFAMSMMESNDWFFATEPTGIPLYTNGTALTGDITNRVQLWDAGSELDEEPAVGANTGTRQIDRNVGDADANDHVRLVPATVQLANGSMFTRPAVASMVRVTITPENDSYFRLRVQNVSTNTTLVTSQGGKPVHVSPVVWSLHRGTAVFFDADMPRRVNGLERLAESGDEFPLIDALRFDRGIPTPLTPGVFVVHRNDAPLFALDNPDRGAGLEAIAEDGNPTTMLSALQGDALVYAGAFDQPVGAAATGGAEAGQVFEVTFDAEPGDRLSFATGFAAANDWFFAPASTGIDLFLGDDPRWGDVTSEVSLYDLGTEVDQELDVGKDTGAQQPAPATGNTDGTATVRRVPLNVYNVPAADHIRVTLTPAARGDGQ